MEIFLRQSTTATPYVHLDAVKKNFVIAGRSIPIDAELFFRPVLNWLERFADTSPKAGKLTFVFSIDFFNIASSKRILFILYQLAEMQKMGWVITIVWKYEKNDADMLEIGKDYALMVQKLHFIFEEFSIEDGDRVELLKIG